ncbi:MAG: NAD(P)-binding domain-containing protein [Planctomycetota bacterium]
MSWFLLLGLVVVLGIALCATIARRAELARMQRKIDERERSVVRSRPDSLLQFPVVDLSRCLGCGTCVRACPENGVLELVHGQAVVVNGAHCVGHAACERECPVGAITVTIANLSQRRDVPVLTETREAVGSPNLFLAGEVTAHALIKTAIEHGTAVAAEIARRTERAPARAADTFDVCVVGAGPAGLACSLEAKRRGLSYVTIDQEAELGGTVAKYPRRKLVMTQPVELPLFGRLARTSYTKEELIDLWHQVAREQELDIRTGEVFHGVERQPDGRWLVRTASHTYLAQHVCLALGRRGTPRKLGVPGEDLPKVAYSLIDAQSFQGRRVLVVGGGDSAVEAALGLAEQPGNEVTLSYRRAEFSRLKARNETRLTACVKRGELRVVFQSNVRAITPDAVELDVEADGALRTYRVANDDVFVMAGGVAPFEVLERSGVSFDPALREAPPPVVEQGSGLLPALGIAFALSLLALAWAQWHSDYYGLPSDARPTDVKHELLRPGRGAGLWFGITAAALVVVNLLYLLRRSQALRFTFGSLRGWMTSHVATGILALLCATLHAAMAPRDTVGGHALLALALLLVTGAIGRYFYAYVPRAANGRELEIEEVKLRLEHMIESGDKSQRGFVLRVQQEISDLVRARQWKSSFFGRVLALVGGRRDLERLLARVADEGGRAGISAAQLQEMLLLARRAYGTAIAAAHYEDLRAVLGTWRYVHRWIAVLMVTLIVLHVVYVLSYSASVSDGRLT